MDKKKKQDLIHKMVQFLTYLQWEMEDLAVKSNNSELSPLLFKILCEIYLDKCITPSVLSRRLSITIPNTSRSLHKLIELGYIIKVKDKIDKRFTHIELSLKGTKLVKSSYSYMDEVLLGQMEVLSQEELEKLSESFFTVMNLIKKTRGISD